MLRRPPEGSATLAWVIAWLWAAGLYAFVPFSRRIVDLFKAHEIRWLFEPIVYATVAAGLYFVWRAIHRQRVVWTPGQWIWLAAPAAVSGLCVFRLRHDPEEALHIVEYGVLALLFYRALVFRHRNWAVYGCTAALTIMVGVGDETIQWLWPGRFFGFRDVAINAGGACLMVVALAFGIRPPYVSRHVPAASAAAACGYAAGLCAVLLACVSCTPSRIARFFPVLGTLNEYMVEYGYRYDESDLGVFQSRLEPEDFAREERERGETIAAVLQSARSDLASYEAFLSEYTPVADPLLHEARVHLFRRDRYAEYARRYRADDAKLRINAWVARREHDFLARRLPGIMGRPGFALPDHVLDATRRLPPPAERYVSPVSNQLFTRIGERSLQLVTGVPMMVCLLLTRHFSRRRGVGHE